MDHAVARVPVVEEPHAVHRASPLRRLFEPFWVIPALVTLAAVALGFALPLVDAGLQHRIGVAFPGGPAGARSVLDRARAVAVEAMAALPSVLPDPAPQALLTSVGVTVVELELRFWSGARQMETREAQDAVIAAVLRAFTDHGVRTGNDVRIVDAGPELRRALRRIAGTPDAAPASPAATAPDEETP